MAEERALPCPVATTLAGGQINSDWEALPEAVFALAAYLAETHAERSAAPEEREEAYVMFRCGTVARVRPADPEFGGYAEPGYKFPEHRAEHAAAVSEAMGDNARVWEAQRALPEPAGKSVRQAYAALIAPGYPYPGRPDDQPTVGFSQIEAGSSGRLVFVYRPSLDSGRRVFNAAFARRDPRPAVEAACNHRRCDYMFPEVVAVFPPNLALWGYRDAAGGLWTRRPADGRALQFSPGNDVLVSAQK